MNTTQPVDTVNTVDDLARTSVEGMPDYIAIRYEPTAEEMEEMYGKMCAMPTLEEKEQL